MDIIVDFINFESFAFIMLVIMLVWLRNIVEKIHKRIKKLEELNKDKK